MNNTNNNPPSWLDIFDPEHNLNILPWFIAPKKSLIEMLTEPPPPHIQWFIEQAMQSTSNPEQEQEDSL